MARVALPVIGAAVGFYFGGPQGALWGWQIGSLAGSIVDPQIIQGPRIGEIAAQTSQEGGSRPIIFGLSPPFPGNIIFSGPPRIVKKKKSGKGGPKVVTESVFRTYAIGVCEGPIDGYIRIWRNGILVYDVRVNKELTDAENAKFLEKARLFLGTYAQNPSPDIEAILTPAPAYRSTAYVVMANDDLTDQRGAIPQYIFQVERNADPKYVYLFQSVPVGTGFGAYGQYLLDQDLECIAALNPPTNLNTYAPLELVSWHSPGGSPLPILGQRRSGSLSIPESTGVRFSGAPPFRYQMVEPSAYFPIQTSPLGSGDAVGHKLFADDQYMATCTRGTLGVYRRDNGYEWTSLPDSIFNGNAIKTFILTDVTFESQPGSWFDVSPDGNFAAIAREAPNFVGSHRLTLYRLYSNEDWRLTALGGAPDFENTYSVHFLGDETMVGTILVPPYAYRMTRTGNVVDNTWTRGGLDIFTTPLSTWGTYFVSSPDREHVFMGTQNRSPYLIWGVRNGDNQVVQQAQLPSLAAAEISQMAYSDDGRYLLVGQKDSGIRVYERTGDNYALKKHINLDMTRENAPDILDNQTHYGMQLTRVSYPFRTSSLDRFIRTLLLEYHWPCSDYGTQAVDGHSPLFSNWGSRAPRGSMSEIHDDGIVDLQGSVPGPITGQFAVEVKAERNGPSTKQLAGTELDAATGTCFFFVRLDDSRDSNDALFQKSMGNTLARIEFGHRNGQFYCAQISDADDDAANVRRTYTVADFALERWHLVMFRQAGSGVAISVNGVDQALEINSYANESGTTQSALWFDDIASSNIGIGRETPVANTPSFRICQVGIAVNRLLSVDDEASLNFVGKT